MKAANRLVGGGGQMVGQWRGSSLSIGTMR
jgi:hypothetical protein